jgi:hypothetical protein
MPEAVRQDLANILVGHGDADAAEGYITRNAIRDVHVIDLLAASYAEMGKDADAYAINRIAIDADNYATPATKCRRLVKHIVLTADASDRELPIQQLRTFVADYKRADPTCIELVEAVACWHKPGGACAAHFWRRNIDVRTASVVSIYFAWPARAHWYEWWNIGDHLRLVLAVPGAIDLALSAYEASLKAHPSCTDERAAAINTAIVEIRASPSGAAYEPRLHRLAHLCAQPAVATPGP